MLRRLIRKNDSKILMLILDGLGGIRNATFPRTALETATTPNLDALAADGICGRSLPISIGVTPGSGPAHFALFGYDPLDPHNDVGRGVLEVSGTGFELRPEDVAIRGNFATSDAAGLLTDRRAGRLAHSEGVRLCRLLGEAIKELDGVEVIVMPVRDYRFGLVLRGEGLSPQVDETDPQLTGRAPLPPKPRHESARRTAAVIAAFVERSAELLKGEPRANTVLMRGISSLPRIEPLSERYGLRGAAVAAYPLYRGVAKLCGMDLVETGPSVEEEFEALRSAWNGGWDFFFVHVKKTDSCGEDGDLAGKAAAIEEVDRLLPLLLELKPDVIIVTGDHSTPCALKAHSWHPVPFLLYSNVCGADGASAFSESECDRGALGVFPAASIMELALANSGRLLKHGA